MLSAFLLFIAAAGAYVIKQCHDTRFFSVAKVCRRLASQPQRRWTSQPCSSASKRRSRRRSASRTSP